MANYHSTGSACPAKTLPRDDLYTLSDTVPYFVCEPGRPPYNSPVPEARQATRQECPSAARFTRLVAGSTCRDSAA